MLCDCIRNTERKNKTIQNDRDMIMLIIIFFKQR